MSYEYYCRSADGGWCGHQHTRRTGADKCCKAYNRMYGYTRLRRFKGLPVEGLDQRRKVVKYSYNDDGLLFGEHPVTGDVCGFNLPLSDDCYWPFNAFGILEPYIDPEKREAYRGRFRSDPVLTPGESGRGVGATYRVKVPFRRGLTKHTRTCLLTGVDTYILGSERHEVFYYHYSGKGDAEHRYHIADRWSESVGNLWEYRSWLLTRAVPPKYRVGGSHDNVRGMPSKPVYLPLESYSTGSSGKGLMTPMKPRSERSEG